MTGIGTQAPGRRILILGADGFIGRHIAFHLRDRGHPVIAAARRTGRLAGMGFQTVAADLTRPETHDPAFWRPHLAGGTGIVIAAGLLTGSEAAFEAVHIAAPRALLAAREAGAPAVLISAIGLNGQTAFARWRRSAEKMAMAEGATILRPGLVVADTSYGGSSLLRALAAMPFAVPVVGSGEEPVNPIHAEDLAAIVADCLASPPPRDRAWEVGGPETVTQAGYLALLRRWLGLRPAPFLHLPRPLARAAGRLGDALRMGPVSATFIAMLDSGTVARATPLLDHVAARPAPVSRFVLRRPAGTQDLWAARLYLLKPLIRLTLAALWIASGLLGLFTPAATVEARLGLAWPWLIPAARLFGLIDLAIAVALLRNLWPVRLALIQIALVAGYTAGLTLLAPQLWLDPFGGLLKNLPILALLLVHLALAEER
jgi:uncharacterized protein YbjT (DUF2867 family)